MYYMDKEKNRQAQEEYGAHFNIFCPKCGALLSPPPSTPTDIEIVKQFGGLGFGAYCDCGWHESQNL